MQGKGHHRHENAIVNQVTHAFALWPLGFVTMLALVFISARPLTARREREAHVTTP